MKYHGTGARPAPSPHSGFWATRTDVHDVTETTHVRYLAARPRLFGFTKDEVIAAYTRHGERLGAEGAARNELVRLALSRGWLRVRHYSTTSAYWELQVDRYPGREKTIAAFARWAIGAGIMHADASVLVHVERGANLVYRSEDGGVGLLLGR